MFSSILFPTYPFNLLLSPVLLIYLFLFPSCHRLFKHLTVCFNGHPLTLPLEADLAATPPIHTKKAVLLETSLVFLHVLIRCWEVVLIEMDHWDELVHWECLQRKVSLLKEQSGLCTVDSYFLQHHSPNLLLRHKTTPACPSSALKWMVFSPWQCLNDPFLFLIKHFPI